MAISPKRARKNSLSKNPRALQEKTEEDMKFGAARLAEFFPGALPMHVPVSIRREQMTESSAVRGVIEFGTPREVIFTCAVPFEFGEMLRIINTNCSLDAKARVVAMQVGDSQYALAVRFAEKIRNWIIQE